jgi:chloride channel protein, CIC family
MRGHSCSAIKTSAESLRGAIWGGGQRREDLGENSVISFLSGAKRQFGQAIKPHVLLLCVYAILVGALAGVVAEAVLKMIYFFTHLFFSGHLSFKEVYPDHFHLGLWVILVPPVGGLVAGLIIHYWEPTVKGHGTPEAMQSVLIGHSVLRLRVGILKPFASALAIGTGGPFGAEGPIIQTGGVLGSVVAQVFHLQTYDRRVLLACGASAGLAATFLTPFAGVMIAIELLLFEFAARSFIPVGVATCTATVIAIYFRGTKPLFAAPHPAMRHGRTLAVRSVRCDHRFHFDCRHLADVLA